MRTKKFNLISLLISVLVWLLYISSVSAMHPALAVVFAAVAVAAGIVGELFIKGKKAKENPELIKKIDYKDIFHYVLTFIALSLIFYSFSVFSNTSYGLRIWGTGKYENEMSFWDIGEIIPDIAYNLVHNILPLAMVLFAVYRKSLAFCAAGFMTWIGILNLNTSKVFGYYEIVAASGNNSGREVIVYNYANTVVSAMTILLLGIFVVALVDIIIIRPKKVVVAAILVCALIAGGVSSYIGYNAYVEAKTYDVEKRKNEIYVDTKAGSEKWQEENFHNKYGDMSTPCAYPGCERNIVTSGDSNCCSVHSNRCGNCNCYIDGDAMYCMDCIKDALD